MNSTSNKSSTAEPNTPAQEYKVGPGFPPKEYRFKKGQSGNPKGRKPKPRSLIPDLKRIFEEALSEKVTLRAGEEERILTMGETGIKQLVAQYAKGDRHARRDVFYFADKFGVDLLAGSRDKIEEALAPDRQAILDSWFAHRTEAMSGSCSNPSRVFAPPELLDDDSEASE